MTNKTRLDSLQPGERFRLSAHGGTVYSNLGVDHSAPAYQVTSKPGRLEGSLYVFPVDAPPPMPAVSAEEPSYMMFARSNVRGGAMTGPRVVEALLARIDRLEKQLEHGKGE